MSTDQTSKPELIEDERGHDDCFDWSGPVATRGRVWVDAKRTKSCGSIGVSAVLSTCASPGDCSANTISRPGS